MEDDIRYYNSKKIIKNSHLIILRKFLDEEYNSASKYLEDKDDDIIHFYILKNNELVSYFHMVEFNKGEFFIYYLFTNINLRGKGNAKKLIEYSFTFCNFYNIKIINSMVNINNIPSKKLFISLKFEIDKIKDDYIYFIKYL